MPTTTNHTAAEIVRAERDIAKGVMGWDGSRGGGIFVDRSKVPYRTLIVGRGPDSWSPWHNAADALEVLERLANPKDAPFGVTFWRQQKLWIAWIGAISLDQRYVDAMAPGPHFGPAVCMLAEKVMEERKEKR